MASRPITTSEDQSTTFIELFFDLVFVYAVTQTVSLVDQELSWAGVAHAVIVFWLVWWAWTQFTWALNSADTTHPAIEAVVLAATALAFLMAVTVPDAFGDAGGWFAATYIAVRVVGLALYGRVAWDDVAKRAAVRRFALLSTGGLAAVAAGGVVGLHLALDRGVSGIEVRAAHQRMGKPDPSWPRLPAPERTGAMTVFDVAAAGAMIGSVTGHARAVRAWAGAVWQAWAAQHTMAAALADRLVR